MEQEATEPEGFARERGIVDRASGLQLAIDAGIEMRRRASSPLPGAFEFDIATMTLLSLLGRAQAFHDGAIGALRADNPHATFTLVRAHAENAAALVWLTISPGDVATFYPEAPVATRIKIGRLTNRASQRMAGFRAIYEQLSSMAHPTAASALSHWHNVTDSDNRVRFSSKAEFKSDDDFKTACLWLIELAEATGYLWPEVWHNVMAGDKPPPSWRGTDGRRSN